MIASPNHSARGSTPVRLVVVHTAEGARTKESLGRYFQGNVGASSHVGIDAAGIESYVDYNRASWTLLNGNPISDNAELCAFARWTREQWMSTSTVDGCISPRAILDNTAAWIRARCLARGIPIRKLTPAQVDAGMAGVIGHADWTYSNVGQGDHTDPESGHYGKGTGFPWDYVIARAADGMTLEGELDARERNALLGIEEVLAEGGRISETLNGIKNALGQAEVQDPEGDHIGTQVVQLGQKLDALAAKVDAMPGGKTSMSLTDADRRAIAKAVVEEFKREGN